MSDDDLRVQLAHLYRRAGFGARPDQLDEAVAAGYATTVERLTDPSTVDRGAAAVPDPSFAVTSLSDLRGAGGAGRQAALRTDAKTLDLWWLDRMVASSAPWREKLTFVWHGHFATAIQKVRLASYMYAQNRLFRSLGTGSFETLTQAVAKDPAMLIWLDSNTNKKGHANENFARELMELFTLGIGNYTEDDVKEAARCFTGWTLNPATDGYLFRPAQHDDGIKTVLGSSGNFGGEDVISILTHSRAGSAFVAARLWSHLAYPVGPADPVVQDLVSVYADRLDITELARAIFLHPQFLAPASRSGLVKQPVEYVVGAVRAFGLKPSEHPEVLTVLTALGQTPFNPPNVGGWPQNGYWLSTAAALTRMRFAALMAERADLSSIAGTGAHERAARLGTLLSTEWSAPTAALLNQPGDPRVAVALALVAPDYVLN